MTHGGGKEDESAVLWLPAPAAPRPPPAADPREGPQGRRPAAGRARASPKRGRAGPSARRFLLRGRGCGRRLRACLGPGAPRLIQGRRVPAREPAEALPGGSGWAVALPAGGGGGAWFPGEPLPTRRPGPLGCSECRVGCGRRGETRPHAKATRRKPALYLGVPSVFASSQTKSEGRGTLVPAAG